MHQIGFFGYISSGGVPTGAFGDFVGSLIHRYAAFYNFNPGEASMENEIISSMVQLFQLPSSAWGTQTSGGSLANLTGLLAARETRDRSLWQKSTIYITEQAHPCNMRAIKILGLDPSLIRNIPTDNAFRMQPEALERQLREDIEGGFSPWIVIASIGTTSTGSIDPINKLVELRKRYNFWIHVDAAYGGFFKLVAQCQSCFEGVSEVDSIVLDPHKSLFMPFGTGVVLVRNGDILQRSLSYEAVFFSDMDSTEKSPANFSVELTRPSRAPRIYLSLKTFGTAAFRAALEEKIVLTKYVLLYLKNLCGNPHHFPLEFACEPELTVVAFRIKGEDVLTRKLHSFILKGERVFLSTTQLNGKLYLRICILNFRSHLKHVNECLDEIQHGISLCLGKASL